MKTIEELLPEEVDGPYALICKLGLDKHPFEFNETILKSERFQLDGILMCVKVPGNRITWCLN
jgi:hypothetical protein